MSDLSSRHGRMAGAAYFRKMSGTDKECEEVVMSSTCIEVGFVVEIWTKTGKSFPDQGHVGTVEAVCEKGIQITHLDWLVGLFCGFDRFIPWDQIVEISVATPEHDIQLFADQITRRVQANFSKSDREALFGEKEAPPVENNIDIADAFSEGGEK